MAQSIQVKENINKKWIIENESDMWEFSMNQGLAADPGTATAYVGIAMPTARVLPGQCALLKSLNISVTAPCNVFGFIIKNINASGGLQPKLRTPLNMVLTAGSHLLDFGEGIDIYEGGGIQLTYIPTTTVKPAISVQANGLTYTNDHNYDAKNVYLVVGDSKSWGTIGNIGVTTVQNFGDTLYANRVANQLRSEGISVRASNRGFGGAFSADVVYAIRCGIFAKTVPNLLTIDLGANDASAGAAGTPYSDNIQYIMDYFLAKNPVCSIVLLAPPPTDETTRVANIGSYRTSLQAIAALPKYASFDVHYCDTTPNLTLNNTNYVEQTNGTRLHPKGDTGHAILYNNIYPVIQQTEFYSNNIPS